MDTLYTKVIIPHIWGSENKILFEFIRECRIYPARKLPPVGLRWSDWDMLTQTSPRFVSTITEQYLYSDDKALKYGQQRDIRSRSEGQLFVGSSRMRQGSGLRAIYDLTGQPSGTFWTSGAPLCTRIGDFMDQLHELKRL
jgi:hypothetical protein